MTKPRSPLNVGWRSNKANMKSMIALLFSFLALVPLALSVPAVDVDGRVAALEQHVKMLTLAQKLKALEEQPVDEENFSYSGSYIG